MPISGGLQFIKPQQVLEKIGLVEGKRVADLGCGNLGYFIIPAAKIVGKTGVAYAVDVQKSVLEAVKSKAKLEGLSNLEYVITNLEKVGSCPIATGSLDAVFLINVLFQNKKRAQMMQEAVRLLKKGGKLLVIDWKKIALPFGPPLEIRVDPQNIKGIAQELNLQLEEESDVSQYFWSLIFVK